MHIFKQTNTNEIANERQTKSNEHELNCMLLFSSINSTSMHYKRALYIYSLCVCVCKKAHTFEQLEKQAIKYTHTHTQYVRKR